MKNNLTIYKLPLIITFLFFCSCSTKQESSNSGDLKAIKLTENQIKDLKDFTINQYPTKEILITDFDKSISPNIFTDIDFIKLETTSESVIAEVDKVVIMDEKIFILDKYIGKNIFVFNLKGKFLTKIRAIGEGPNELTNPTDFYVDSQKHEIAVFDQFFHKIVYYDYNLTPKKQSKILYRFGNMKILPNNKLLLSVNGLDNSHISEINDYGLLLLDSSFNIIRKGFQLNKEEKNNNYTLRDHFYQNGKSDIIWIPKYKNSIYQINKDETIDKKFSINFKTKEVPEEYYSKNVKELFKIAENQGLYYYSGEYAESDSIVFFHLSTRLLKNYIFVFYDKNNRKYAYGKIGMGESKIPVINSPLTSYNDKLVTVLDSEFLETIKKDKSTKFSISKKLEKIMDLTKEGDNPIIQFYKISLKNEKTY